MAKHKASALKSVEAAVAKAAEKLSNEDIDCLIAFTRGIVKQRRRDERLAKLKDARVEDHGSVSLLFPLTDAAKDWVAEHLAVESWQMLGGGVAIEPRYVGDIVQGMQDEGLVV